MEAPKAIREVIVANREGFHLRAAMVLMHAARKFKADITILKGGMTVDAKSTPLQLLALGAFHGDVLTLEAVGDDAEQAVEELQLLFERHFEEGEGPHYQDVDDSEPLEETRGSR
ncbi:MAG: HPr family phosphocarrier protein [Planctomycetia bacterium]|jgi:phosphocarrier protein